MGPRRGRDPRSSATALRLDLDALTLALTGQAQRGRLGRQRLRASRGAAAQAPARRSVPRQRRHGRRDLGTGPPLLLEAALTL